MLCLVVVHLILLHRAGRHTQLGVVGMGGLVPFSPYYTIKDTTSIGLLCLFSGGGLCYPWVFADTENWAEADPLSRPVHIQPEWYFLFAYAILRAVPNKLGGVIALVMSVGVLALLPFGCARQPRIDQVILVACGILLSV
jgi:ubiquinol-cytochrome c reductase cytochrome b subunit